MKTYKCNRCNNFNSKQFNDISRHLCKNEPCKISLEGYAVKKDELIKSIRDSGCDMLNNEITADTTKEEIVEYLKECDCPSLKKLYKNI